MDLIEQWRNGSLASTKRLQTIRVLATIESKCNLSCEHCYWSHELDKTVDIDWTEQIDFLKKIRVSLFFVGRILNEKGAKFLRLAIQGEAQSDISIIDNGLTILNYPEFFPFYSSINISIDGWKEEHDAQRKRKGLFDIAWNAVLTLKDQGLDPIISSAISPITMKMWSKFEELLIENNIPMSVSPVWSLPETAKRGTACFFSPEMLRETFLKLVDGMPKLINLYNLDHIEILKDILARYEWSMDDDVGDCLRAVLPSRTIIVYRPVSLVSVAELALHWDGKFYTPPTYGLGLSKDTVDHQFFDRVYSQNKRELAVWSEITPIIKKGGE